MLGKGLESLIPKKHNQSNNQAPSGGQSFSGNAQPQSQPIPAPTSYQNQSTIPTQSSFAEVRETIVQKVETTSDVPMISGPVFHIEIDKIIINPYQPRKDFDEESLKELASSIREFGILQPLVVSKLSEETENGTKVTYQLIAGQRRLMASKLLGLKTVPVIIRNPMKKTEALEMAIVENIQRADLHVIETARAYARLSEEFGLTQREIASRLGKSREAVGNALRLLSLPAEIQDAIASQKISESHARLLMQVEEPEKQIALFHQIIEGGVSSVRDLKKHVEHIKKQEPTSNSESSDGLVKVEDLELKNMEKELSEFLGAPVKVEFSRSGGKITIHFYSPEEAMGIAQKINPVKEEY